jgi:DNA topoisomerase I
MSVEELTYDEALAMLADKAAQGPPKKKAARKAVPKKPAPKKAAKKRSTTKKTTKKAGKAVEDEAEAPF